MFSNWGIMALLGDPGLIVPPMTPFTPDGDIDYDAYSSQIDFIVEKGGATAVALMAVEAQEYRCLSFEQRAEAIRRGAEAVDGRLPVTVGLSADSYRRAVDLGQVAHEVDAAAGQLLIPRRPQGGATRIDELASFFRLVGDELDLPLVAYHNPGPGATLSPDELVSLAEVDAVVGFKESSRNLRHVLNLVERIDRAGLARYYTTMEMLLVTLLLGGSGATMPAPGSILARELISAFEDGDVERAAEIQRSFASFPMEFLDQGFPVVMKAALEHLGIDVGVPYPPAEPLDDDVRRSIAAELDAMGLSAPATN